MFRNHNQKQNLSNNSGQTAGIVSLLLIYVIFGFAQASNEFRVLFLEGQGLTATDCGQILALSSLLSAVSRPLAGALADKLRSRRVIFIGTLIAWIAVLAALLLTEHVRLAGFALCAAVIPLLSVTEPVTYGMIEASGVQATILHPKLDFSLIRVCLSLGYSVINFLYTPIVNRFGSTAPFFCTILFAGAMLLFSGSMRKFETYTSETKKTSGGGKLEFNRLFQNYYLVAFVLLNFILALGSHTQNYMYYLIDAIGLDGSLVGVAIGIRVLGEIIIMPLVPFLKRYISLPMMQALACLFRILQMLLFITCKNPYIIMGGTILNGFSAGISLATTAVYLRMMAPEGLDTTTLSLNTVMTNVGSILINLVSGVIVDSMGIFAVYRFSLIFLLVWLVLYFGTWAVGVRILHKAPPVPMFIRRNSSASIQ